MGKSKVVQVLWCLSLDLSKAFDRIEYEPLLEALRLQGVTDAYISILAVIYLDQRGHVEGSRRFCIQRGVKQGDVLSPLLFNAGLEAALRKWKTRVTGKGIVIDSGDAPANVRYADDIMIFATSPDDLTFVAVALKEELANVGRQKPRSLRRKTFLTAIPWTSLANQLTS